MPLLIF